MLFYDDNPEICIFNILCKFCSKKMNNFKKIRSQKMSKYLGILMGALDFVNIKFYQNIEIR